LNPLLAKQIFERFAKDEAAAADLDRPDFPARQKIINRASSETANLSSVVNSQTKPGRKGYLLSWVRQFWLLILFSKPCLFVSERKMG
jgi:hypothetical protein